MQFDSGLWMSPLFIFSVCGGLGWDGGGVGRTLLRKQPSADRQDTGRIATLVVVVVLKFFV